MKMRNCGLLLIALCSMSASVHVHAETTNQTINVKKCITSSKRYSGSDLTKALSCLESKISGVASLGYKPTYSDSYFTAQAVNAGYNALGYPVVGVSVVNVSGHALYIARYGSSDQYTIIGNEGKCFVYDEDSVSAVRESYSRLSSATSGTRIESNAQAVFRMTYDDTDGSSYTIDANCKEIGKTGPVSVTVPLYVYDPEIMDARDPNQSFAVSIDVTGILLAQ